MADVLHRPQHEAATRGTVPAVTEGVPESPEVREHGLRKADGVPPAKTHVRWLRWMPVVLLVLAGLVAALVAVTWNGGVDDVDVIEWPTATEGPGSTSLGPTTAQALVIEWPTATEGPGSTSLGPTTPDG